MFVCQIKQKSSDKNLEKLKVKVQKVQKKTEKDRITQSQSSN
jgi:hypothetical protein